MLNVPNEHVPEELHVDVDVFGKMKKLKLLKLSGIRPCGQFTYLSNELCYLDWDNYPTKFLPSNFHPKILDFHGVYENIGFDLKINGYGLEGRTYDVEYKGSHVILMKETKYFDELSEEYQPIKNWMKKRPKLSPGPPNICDDDICYIQASAVTIDYIRGTRQERKVKKMGIHLIMEEQGEG
ncbi:uncharacterized protein LOC132311633 [Cornus florida]|uniref:uncharacterized protein LOC132311633 n=1 Tax=Cornus florida TaxID=4283 RepID=UPI00289866D0|nr:uncharacterized protein LOC132311633 [Cornus florida]